MAGGPFPCPRDEGKKRAGVSPSAKPSPKLWPDRRSLRVAKSLEACALAGVRPQDDDGFFEV